MSKILVNEYVAFINMANKTENFYKDFMDDILKINNVINGFSDGFQGPIATNAIEQWNIIYNYFCKMSESEINRIIDCLITVLKNYIEADKSIN